MTTFLDGPAQGKQIVLRRSPFYLRVTNNGADALDQLDDTPRPSETLVAYQREGDASWCHVNRAGNKGGMLQIAAYRVCAVQPTDAEMRDAFKWKEWCYRVAGVALPYANCRKRVRVVCRVRTRN